MSGDKVARLLTGLAVLAVAVISAAISYGHIYDLTLVLHQSALAACLMPVAIDGLIAVGSVVLLQSGSRLGWLGIGPGLALSVFANVESGIRYGALAAVWAGIPALSFFLATFIFERWLTAQARSARPVPSAEQTGETVAAEVPTAPVMLLETVADAVPGESAGEASGAAPSVPVDGPDDVPADVPPVAPRVVPVAPVRPVPRSTQRRTSPARPRASEKVFSAELAAGTVPSLRAIKSKMHVGTARAQHVQRELQEVMQ